jgi:hypothetical protein
MPGSLPVKTNLHTIRRARLPHRNIPVSRLERHLKFHLELFPSLLASPTTNHGRPPGMLPHIQIPIRKEPMRILGHQKDQTLPISPGEFPLLTQRRSTLHSTGKLGLLVRRNFPGLKNWIVADLKARMGVRFPVGLLGFSHRVK